jgi:hypothetical protein
MILEELLKLNVLSQRVKHGKDIVLDRRICDAKVWLRGGKSEAGVTPRLGSETN